MKIAVMQPYFMPYIGYYQLINSVDKFVIYDNIEYTKKGWINRNRILVNSQDQYISIPLKKDSDFLEVNRRYLSETANIDLKKILNRINELYRKAPYRYETINFLEKIFFCEERNLFNFIENSLVLTLNYLGINTPIVVSSTIPINHSLKSEDKVIEICNSLAATAYVNPIGGVNLYSQSNFHKHGISLSFIKTKPIFYKQFQNNFIPFLSIIDVLMFNSLEQIRQLLDQCEIQTFQSEVISV